jgi:hypothetical protein
MYNLEYFGHHVGITQTWLTKKNGLGNGNVL